MNQNGKEYDFLGIFENSSDKFDCNLKITANYLRIKSEGETTTNNLDLIIPYKNLIYFATCKDKNSILIDYSQSNDDGEENSKVFNFYPTKTEQSKL
jgi:hypothetical protein